MLKEMEEWIKNHKFKPIIEFHSILSREENDKSELYERLQYIKTLSEKKD